jgi:hypothetical protein
MNLHEFASQQVRHDVNFPLVASFLATFGFDQPYKMEVEAPLP